MSLGEDRNSFGYGGTGKVATNKKFKEYGESYGPGDHIACFVVSHISGCVACSIETKGGWCLCGLCGLEMGQSVIHDLEACGI